MENIAKKDKKAQKFLVRYCRNDQQMFVTGCIDPFPGQEVFEVDIEYWFYIGF